LLVLGLCVVVVALARQIGTLHLRLGPRGALEMDDEGPPLGEGLAPIEATALDGRRVALGGPGTPQLLLFVSPGCQVCEQVLPSIGAVAQNAGMAPYIVTDLDPTETALSFAHKRLNAPVVPSVEAARAYSVPGTPYVVALDELGVVRAKGTVNNLEQMEGLVDTARVRRETTEGGVRVDA
jgi:methylamine dehydrogenase accessory protein MauD